MRGADGNLLRGKKDYMSSYGSSTSVGYVKIEENNWLNRSNECESCAVSVTSEMTINKQTDDGKSTSTDNFNPLMKCKTLGKYQEVYLLYLLVKAFC